MNPDLLAELEKLPTFASLPAEVKTAVVDKVTATVTHHYPNMGAAAVNWAAILQIIEAVLAAVAPLIPAKAAPAPTPAPAA
jgi:hypothetical protein